MNRVSGDSQSALSIRDRGLRRHGSHSDRLKSVRNATTAGLWVLLLGGCQGELSVFSTSGDAAADIAWVTWVMLLGTGLFLVAMSALGLHAALRKSSAPVGPSGRSIIIGGGVLLPLIVTALLLVQGVRTGHSMLPLGPAELEVRITAHQWWWQVEYSGPGGAPLYTANELHLPVDRKVDIHVTSHDVIHSFWVPNLGGKIDALPGRVNTIRLQPRKIARMRGRCAEFCGAQHTHMAFEVEVHETADFRAFLDNLAAAGPEQTQSSGQTAFRQHCAECHSLDPHEQRSGPGLATLPERQWLGAGALRNSSEGLRQWIAEHRSLKPGNRMPDHSALDAETIEALARFLEERP